MTRTMYVGGKTSPLVDCWCRKLATMSGAQRVDHTQSEVGGGEVVAQLFDYVMEWMLAGNKPDDLTVIIQWDSPHNFSLPMKTGDWHTITPYNLNHQHSRRTVRNMEALYRSHFVNVMADYVVFFQRAMMVQEYLKSVGVEYLMIADDHSYEASLDDPNYNELDYIITTLIAELDEHRFLSLHPAWSSMKDTVGGPGPNRADNWAKLLLDKLEENRNDIS